MAGNKVKFHTLERLDLVDVELMQDNRQDYDLLELGEFAGLGEGCLRPFQGVTIDNDANTISLPGFSFLSAFQSAPRKAYVHVYDDTTSGNSPSDGLISFEGALATIQSYYNLNGSVPTAPIEANWETFSETAHGSFYPFIWARALEVEDNQDQRRFWSAASAQEITSVVNTRKTHKTQIIVSYQRPNAGSTLDWAKVGRVTGWTVTGSVISLNTVRAFMLADSVYKLNPAISSLDIEPYSAGYGGLAHTFALIKNKVDQFYRDGSDDGTEFFSELGFHEQPRLSLQGLDAYARRTYEEALADSLRKRKDNCSITGMVRYKIGSVGGSSDIEILQADVVNGSTDTELFTDVDSVLDFTFDYEYVQSTGAYVAGVPVAVMDLNSDVHRATTATSVVFILPSSLLGRKIRSTNFTWLNNGRHGTTQQIFAVTGGINANGFGYTPCTPGVVQIFDGADLLDSIEINNQVREVTYYDNKMQQQTVVGVKFQITSPGAFAYNAADSGCAYKIQLVLNANV